MLMSSEPVAALLNIRHQDKSHILATLPADFAWYALIHKRNIFPIEQKLTMEIEDKESAGGEVTVKLDKNLIERTVSWLQGCIAAEDSKLRVALLWSVPTRKRARTHWKYITPNSCIK